MKGKKRKKAAGGTRPPEDVFDRLQKLLAPALSEFIAVSGLEASDFDRATWVSFVHVFLEQTCHGPALRRLRGMVRALDLVVDVVEAKVERLRRQAADGPEGAGR
jgi:hypothetical protein